MAKRVLITETGLLSALGTGFEQLAAGLAGPPQSATVKEFEFHQFADPVNCLPIRDFDPVAVLGKKGLRNKDNATKYILGAFESSGLKAVMESATEPNRPGICIGTAFGSIQSIGDFLSDSIVNGVGNVNPQAFANTVINAPTGNANIRFAARNLSATIATGFNAGIDAFIYAYDHILRGYLPSIVAGGLEEISYYCILGLERTGILSKSGIGRPFSVDADGCVPGEACALALLEEETAARDRDATALAEIAGVGSSFDPQAAADGTTDCTSVRHAITSACSQAGITVSDIDFVVSSASGNPRSDGLEAKAIRSLFGEKKPVVAYKALTGECYGASGALNILCALSDMKNKRISGIGAGYPCIEEIPLAFVTMQKESTFALIMSCSCDGNCSALVLKNLT